MLVVLWEQCGVDFVKRNSMLSMKIVGVKKLKLDVLSQVDHGGVWAVTNDIR